MVFFYYQVGQFRSKMYIGCRLSNLENILGHSSTAEICCSKSHKLLQDNKLQDLGTIFLLFHCEIK